MLRSSLCDYSAAFILVSETKTFTEAGTDDAPKRLYERKKEVVFKNCALFTDCISEIKLK